MSLKLSDLLSEFPHIALASESESAELLEYYHQTELAAKESAVIYKRDPHFFAFLRERSEKFFVFTLKDEQGKLQGVAVASFRPGYIDGKPQMVGYLGDLRVSLNRKLIREWRKFYGKLLEFSPAMEETGHCRYFQTALMSTNAFSKNNLAETKIPHLHYKELARYQMVNIIGKFASAPSSYQVQYADPEDRNDLMELLSKDHLHRMFGHDWTREFSHRLGEWKNFSLNDWIIVRAPDGKLLAATCLWNPIGTKQIIVPKIPLIFYGISKISALVPGLQLKPLPLPGRAIDILYLNQISFTEGLSRKEQKRILRAIIDLAFKKSFHMLAYCDFEREALTTDMRSLITQRNQMGLFSVHYKDEKGVIRDELTLNDDDPTPAFDMALV